MKNFSLVAILLCISSQSFALDNKAALVDLLSKYEQKSLNGDCQVSFNATTDVFSIKAGQKQDSLSKRIQTVTQEGSILTLGYSNYDGKAEVNILPRQSSLKVIMTWVDNELGPNKSAFCEIYLKN